MEHNAKNINGEEQNLNKQMVNLYFPYFMHIFAKFKFFKVFKTDFTIQYRMGTLYRSTPIICRLFGIHVGHFAKSPHQKGVNTVDWAR